MSHAFLPHDKWPASFVQGWSRDYWLDKGPSFLEGQFWAWNLLHLPASAPTVCFAVMDLLINEPVYSIACKLARIGIKEKLHNGSTASVK